MKGRTNAKTDTSSDPCCDGRGRIIPGAIENRCRAVRRAKNAANIIIGTEQLAWEAMKNKDAKFFEANLSADSSMIGYIGVLDKTAAVNLIAKMPCETKSHTLTNFKVTFFTFQNGVGDL